jgi:tetratricopeptide (TPR) repeat protein
LYGLPLVTALAVALFYVFARYRYPIMPIAALFAGVAVVEVISLGRLKSRRMLLAVACAVLPTAVVVNLTVNPERRLNAMAWGNLGTALVRDGNMDAAAGFLEQTIEVVPESALMHYNLGLAYWGQGRLADAVDRFRTAMRITPDLAEANYPLAIVLERMGHREQAAFHYRRFLDSISPATKVIVAGPRTAG